MFGGEAVLVVFPSEILHLWYFQWKNHYCSVTEYCRKHWLEAFIKMSKGSSEMLQDQIKLKQQWSHEGVMMTKLN